MNLIRKYLLFFFFIISYNSFAQKIDTLLNRIEKIQSENRSNYKKIIERQQKDSILFDSLQKEFKLVKNQIQILEEKPIHKDIIKLIIYYFAVFTTFLLAAFGLSENIADIYFDGLDLKEKYYSSEPDSEKTKNFFLSIIALVSVLILTVFQVYTDVSHRIELVLVYIIILCLSTFLFLKTHNSFTAQKYPEKLQLIKKSIQRFFWRIFNKKNYCEVCLKNCTKKEAQIKYIKQKENNDIALVRFGHPNCLTDYFSNYSSSAGAYSPYDVKSFNIENIDFEINNLTDEISNLNEKSNREKYIIARKKIKKIQIIYTK